MLTVQGFFPAVNNLPRAKFCALLGATVMIFIGADWFPTLSVWPFWSELCRPCIVNVCGVGIHGTAFGGNGDTEAGATDVDITLTVGQPSALVVVETVTDLTSSPSSISI